MVTIISGLQLLMMIVVALQDFKRRAVLWILFPVIFLLNFLLMYLNTDSKSILINLIFNSCILTVQMLVLTVYFSIRNKKLTSIINSYMGTGDIFMLLCMTIILTPVFYLIYVITSLTASLIIFFLFIKSKEQAKTIPLAGVLSLVFIPVLCIYIFSPTSKLLFDLSTLNLFF